MDGHVLSDCLDVELGVICDINSMRWFEIPKHPRGIRSMSAASPNLRRNACHGEVSEKSA